MFHLTVFAGSEVGLTDNCRFILTIFGGTDVHKPTLAKRLMQEKHRLSQSRPTASHNESNLDRMLDFFHSESRDGDPLRRRRGTFVLTVFGAVEIKPASLAEEFMDMRELVSSGLITESEWDQLIGRLYDSEDMDTISSFTLFGAIGQEKLDDDEEIKKIRSASELGLINDDEERALRSVVGRDPQQVRMLLRQTAFSHTA